MKFKSKVLKYMSMVVALKSVFISVGNTDRVDSEINSLNQKEVYKEILNKIKSEKSAESDNCGGGGDGFK